MLKLIVGLGNPGRQYEKTRHNVGFLFLDRLHSAGWAAQTKFQCLTAEYALGSSKILLVKPQTFMNKSGACVGPLMRYYKIAPEELLVVHDELEFAEGAVKLKLNGGHGGHNGLRDIIAHLGCREFLRLRIGIGRPAANLSVADYVLSAPSRDGLTKIEAALEVVENLFELIVRGDYEGVMNQLHG